ncbi:putative ferredoxin [Corynebacterium efficiens YS-314]|uniref:Putative ferredoxin n=2 Tax=Corynebacterium efficiens TaxID=152794 RepID=Q8FLL6_COREF|nr:putative ferredoxin [Corynebacterium efficiens YS-314]
MEEALSHRVGPDFRIADVDPTSTPGFERDIVIFREGDRFYAIDDACTHVGASHLKSRVEDGVVECWLHKGKFCLESGEPVRYPARIAAQTHAVQVINGVVTLFPGVHPRDAS